MWLLGNSLSEDDLIGLFVAGDGRAPVEVPEYGWDGDAVCLESWFWVGCESLEYGDLAAEAVEAAREIPLNSECGFSGLKPINNFSISFTASAR